MNELTEEQKVDLRRALALHTATEKTMGEKPRPPKELTEYEKGYRKAFSDVTEVLLEAIEKLHDIAKENGMK